MIGAPSIGPGLGGGSGWRRNLAPSPELLTRVAALPPVRDFPTVDVARESRPDRNFRLVGLLCEFRRSLLVGLLLVIIDALAGLAGPVLVTDGVDNRVSTGSQTVLFVAFAMFLIVTLADLIDQVGETFVTGRTAERIMLSLRIWIWAQLQRLSLDYYEREMAGRSPIPEGPRSLGPAARTPTSSSARPTPVSRTQPAPELRTAYRPRNRPIGSSCCTGARPPKSGHTSSWLRLAGPTHRCVKAFESA